MLSDAFALVAERKIREAMERGEFDDLSLKGQPIRPEESSGVPDELKMGYKILKNANCLPQELQLRQEMLRLQDLLASCDDEQEKSRLKKRLSVKQLHYDVLAEKNRRNAAFRQYAGKIEKVFRG